MRIILAFNEFLKFVLLLHFGDRLAGDGVASMVVQVVPVLRDVASSDEHFFVGTIVGVLQVFVEFLFKISFLGQVLLFLHFLIVRSLLRLCHFAF